MRPSQLLTLAMAMTASLAFAQTYNDPNFPKPTSGYALASGPRGIRTLDLLNAIETRSQLRYGPGHGPEGS